MKKQKKGRLFCVLLLALCLVPFVGMLLFGPSDAVSNERLAPKPRLVRAGQVNADVLSETADYIAGRFFLRPALVTANSAIQAAVFEESASDDVILGKDGWLFYADTLADYQGTNPMTGREIFCAARNLALLQEASQKDGAAFLFACAPNKNTIYPAFMPRQYRKTDAVSDLDRLEAELKRQGVSFCDLRETLTARQTLTYYRTDSHWNGYGSHLACAEILRALGKDARTLDETLSSEPHAGDLFQMLYPASGKPEQAPGLQRARAFSYLGKVRGADDQYFETQSSADGTLFVFRDSFGNALHEDLAEQFASAAFSRAMPYDFSQVPAGTEVLIIELAQRNLRWLCQRPPLLPAPERDAPSWEQEAGAPIAVQKTESSFDGLFCYRAEFPDVPEENAQVLFCVDGVWYEACLKEQGFELLAPEGKDIRLVTNFEGVSTCMQVRITT